MIQEAASEIAESRLFLGLKISTGVPPRGRNNASPSPRFRRKPGVDPILFALGIFSDVAIAEFHKRMRRFRRIFARRVGAIDDDKIMLVWQYLRCQLMDLIVR